MSPTLSHILARTYTAHDLHRRLRLLQSCFEMVLYDEPQQIRIVPVEERWERSLQQHTRGADREILGSLQRELRAVFTAATLVGKMAQMYAESERLPVMTLYVPTAFTDAQLAPMAQWVRAEVKPGMLFEVHVDPLVVGGCAFVYRDTHFDWSLRRYLRSRRGLVTSLLNAYGS